MFLTIPLSVGGQRFPSLPFLFSFLAVAVRKPRDDDDLLFFFFAADLGVPLISADGFFPPPLFFLATT